jgi:CHAT domain-containing protein
VRKIFFALFCLAPFWLMAQAMDSAAARQVDSMIRVSRGFIAKKDFDKALEVNAAAEKLALEKFGAESAVYGNCCFNRGRVNFLNVNYPEAQKWFFEVRAIREKTLGKEHLDYAKCLLLLGELFQNMDNYNQAELFFIDAKAIYEKILGKEHDDYTSSLYSLARLYKDKGDYEKAETIYLEYIDILKKKPEEDYPNHIVGLYDLAFLYKDMGNYEKAEPIYIEISQIEQSELIEIARDLPEQELNYFMGVFYDSQDQALSFAQLSGSKEIIPICFDNILFYKGFLLHTAVQTKQLALSDPASAEILNQIKTYKNSLAYLYAQPISDRDSVAVEELEAQVYELEEELVRTVAGWGQATKQVKWQQVQAALKPDEAAIEFVSYRFYEKKQIQTDSIIYAALALLPHTDSPQFIPLFEEKQLAALLQTEGKPKADFYNNLYAAGAKGDELYNLIWKPLEAFLPRDATVYFSPTGLLHRLHLAALPAPNGKTVATQWSLTQLNSTRQLVFPAAASNATTAALYGGIQYDESIEAAVNEPVNSEIASLGRGFDFSQTDSTLRGDTWGYLRWTEVEVETAAEMLQKNGIQVNLKKGAAATETSLKALGSGNASPRVLHIATHGYFFPDPQSEKVRSERVRSEEEEQMRDEKTFEISENPMIRSGLVLAGGNHAWKTGKPLRAGREDGILTAYEISQMNLSNTELVVLSACETGLGDIQGNEGVYGLQRAFKIAGAKHLVMSLWQVPDFQTQAFMAAFYRHWLEDKMPVPEAFRATQSELRAQYGEAFYWAGFVLVE